MNCCNIKTDTFDLIILGGGSAGFSAAIVAEKLGLKTLMVNGGLDIGGTCVNIGCVPSKFLIRASESAYHALHSPFQGIQPLGANLLFSKIIQEKKKLVEELQQKKYKDVVKDFSHLHIVKGWAKFKDKYTIIVNDIDEYNADKFLIATGATTYIPNIEGLNQIDYLTSQSLFDLEEKPESLTILGAGYIGLEIAMAYNRLGVKVRIIESADRILRNQTPDVSEVLHNQMQKEGIEILSHFHVLKLEKQGSNTLIHGQFPDGSCSTIVEHGKIVLATGTKPHTDTLGLENVGLSLTNSGQITVNEKMETNLPHIYAAGDCTNTPAFVYTAAYEGKIAIENAFTNVQNRVDYTYLPWVIFTAPQIAGVGLDEVQAAERNLPFEVSKIAMTEVPKAITSKQTQGFVKLIRNPLTDTLLGARVIANEGGELVQLLSMVIKYQIRIKELAEGLFPYLTLSESIKLAALGFYKDVSKLSCCAS